MKSTIFSRQTVNGGGFQNFSGLSSLTAWENIKMGICQIPLSQPCFLGVILLIWSLHCVADIKRVIDLFACIVQLGPSNGGFARLRHGEEGGAVSVESFSMSAKTSIFALIFVPRLLVNSVLLWLGCRWLIATFKFEDLVLNGCALAFIKETKDLLFDTLVSSWCKREL